MYKNRKNFIRHISALTMSVILAANSLTAFAGVYEEIVPGDVNGDGSVNATDISIVAANVKGKKTLDDETKAKADLNGDGYVNVSDISILAAHVKGKRSVSSLKDKDVGDIALDEGELLCGGSKGKLFTELCPVNGVDTDGIFDYRLRDAKTNEILWTYESKDMYDYLGMKEDGTLVLDSPADDGSKIVIIAPDGSEPVEIPYNYYRAYYDEKHDIIYFEDNGVISRLYDSGEADTVLKLPKHNYLEGFDFDNGIVFTRGPAEKYHMDNMNAISITTGETLWSRPCVSVFGTNFCCVNGELILIQNMLDDEDCYFTHISVFDPVTGEPKGFYKSDNSYMSKIVASEMNGKCVLEDYGNYNRQNQVTIFDPETASIAKVNVGMRDFSQYGHAPVDENTCALYLFGDGNKAVTIDTSGLKYKKLKETADYLESEEYTVKELGEELQEQRKKADALDEKYGVTILIGNEVLNVDPNGMNWTSVEENFDEGYPEELDYQLDMLDEWMDAYPDGFFEKFRTDEITEGYRILLMDDYVDYSGIYAATTWMDNYYGNAINVAVTKDAMNDYMMKATMDHETWHAVEFLVGREYDLDADEWHALNPEDFEYGTEGLDPEDDDYHKYTMFTIDHDNTYFVRNYSFTNEMEDRATIIEWLKPGMKGWDTECYLDNVNDYPKIKAKIKFMADWSKQYFGYVYWEKMFAENETVAGG